MKHIAPIVIAASCLAFAACDPGERTAQAGLEAAPVNQTLEGVWTRTEMVVGAGPDAGRHVADVQPNLYIFTESHYAIAAVDRFTPRPLLGETPTDERRAQIFGRYTGTTGLYTNTDGVLTLNPQVALDPADMDAAVTDTFGVAWVNDEVWLTEESPDGTRNRTRLTRLTTAEPLLDTADPRLQGVWRRAEVEIGKGPEAGTHIADVQPGYYLISQDYLAANYVMSFAPRPAPKPGAKEEERGKAFTPFASFAGTYRVADGKIVVTPLVAKTPGNMQGPPFQPIGIEWAGDDIWLTFTGSDGSQNRTRLTPDSGNSPQ